MMAFFLVMWLIGVGTREQRAAISEYFKNPSLEQGQATLAPPGKVGPGGASDSMIQLGGSMDVPRGPGNDRRNAKPATSKDDLEKLARAQEKQRLDELMQQLHAAIQSSQAMAPFKDQLLLDITSEGLRIQIVDKQNRPMFDLGSARLKDYTVEILHELASFINQVPNPISISGHTDDAPYSSDRAYGNWELSADRANAARRALIEGGLQESKVARVVGLAASVPFDKSNPGAAINRRISIVVMTHDAAEAAKSPETSAVEPAKTSSIVAPASTPVVGSTPPAATPAPTPTSVATPVPTTASALLPAMPPAVRAIQAAGIPAATSSARLP
jgi:chemotaxis protein MotB